MPATKLMSCAPDAEVFGPMLSIDDIKRANRQSGHHYFDPDTMRFFASRVGETVIAGRLFVTSEKAGFDDRRREWSVREFMPDGSIETVGEFGEFDSSAAALRAARHYAAEKHAYYFDGRHGKRGRKVVYVVTARDPWEALERLHSNFRIQNCGIARDYMTGEHYVHLSTPAARKAS